MLQDVKKLLALVTVGFFFAVILILFFVQIPEPNLDLLKIVVMALLSGASMVLGYYFGSSDGSARKTELIGATPSALPAAIEEPPASRAEAGFIRLPLLAALTLIGLLFLAGCATTGTPAANDSPQVLAGKSLLAVKQTIVTAATATDGLCRAGTLKPDTCAQAKAAYELAKPAYDTAVDAYLLMSVKGGDAADFRAALLRVQDLAQNLLLISGGAQ